LQTETVNVASPQVIKKKLISKALDMIKKLSDRWVGEGLQLCGCVCRVCAFLCPEMLRCREDKAVDKLEEESGAEKKDKKKKEDEETQAEDEEEEAGEEEEEEGAVKEEPKDTVKNYATFLEQYARARAKRRTRAHV
jgi:hypothetical protein